MTSAAVSGLDPPDRVLEVGCGHGAVGGGAVWLTDVEASNVIRVDPKGLVKSIPVGDGPTAIGAGDGGVWGN